MPAKKATNYLNTGTYGGLLRAEGAQILAAVGGFIVGLVTYHIALPHYTCGANDWLCFAPLAAALDGFIAGAIAYACLSFVTLRVLRVQHWLLMGICTIPTVLAVFYVLFRFSYKANGLSLGFIFGSISVSWVVMTAVYWAVFSRTGFSVRTRIALAFGAGIVWLAALSAIANVVVTLPT
jgi:hypothetical protein